MLLIFTIRTIYTCPGEIPKVTLLLFKKKIDLGLAWFDPLRVSGVLWVGEVAEGEISWGETKYDNCFH